MEELSNGFSETGFRNVICGSQRNVKCAGEKWVMREIREDEMIAGDKRIAGVARWEVKETIEVVGGKED